MSHSPAPLVSVITVCRNSEAIISECIDSVNAQTWNSLEHIIVDGASSDGTQRHIEKSRQQANSRLSQFVSEPDGGIYDAMNKAVKLARGRYVDILNADG